MLSASFWSLALAVTFALANFYAVGIFVWLLAHALVELPRRLYYLSQQSWDQRHSCFEAGIALEEIKQAVHEWDEAVEKLDLETRHLTSSGPADPKWLACLDALREEW